MNSCAQHVYVKGRNSSSMAVNGPACSGHAHPHLPHNPSTLPPPTHFHPHQTTGNPAETRTHDPIHAHTNKSGLHHAGMHTCWSQDTPSDAPSQDACTQATAQHALIAYPLVSGMHPCIHNKDAYKMHTGCMYAGIRAAGRAPPELEAVPDSEPDVARVDLEV